MTGAKEGTANNRILGLLDAESRNLPSSLYVLRGSLHGELPGANRGIDCGKQLLDGGEEILIGQSEERDSGVGAGGSLSHEGTLLSVDTGSLCSSYPLELLISSQASQNPEFLSPGSLSGEGALCFAVVVVGFCCTQNSFLLCFPFCLNAHT